MQCINITLLSKKKVPVVKKVYFRAMNHAVLHFSWAIACIVLGLWDFFALEQAKIETTANSFLLLLPSIIGAIGLLLSPLGRTDSLSPPKIQQFLVFFSIFAVIHRILWILPMNWSFGLRNLIILTLILGIIGNYWYSKKQSA
ncbi:MAG: hypothetical protein GY810_30130 [Aureispira sp.]|nr:hypothetical protein [Aureispira sp.]